MNGRDEQTPLPRFHLVTPPFSPPSSAFLTMAMIIIIILINKKMIIIITMVMRTVLTPYPTAPTVCRMMGCGFLGWGMAKFT